MTIELMQEEKDQIELDVIAIKCQLSVCPDDYKPTERYPDYRDWHSKTTFAMRMKGARFNRLARLLKEARQLEKSQTQDTVEHVFVGKMRHYLDDDEFKALMHDAVREVARGEV